MNGSLVRQQIRSLIVLIFLAITLSGIAEDVPGPVAVIELEATGVGETLDAALRESFRDAVHRAVGTFISSEQVVKNEELIRDQVTAHSDAFVQGYDKISEKKENGLFHVKIRARVARAKLAQQLSKSGLTSKTEVQGENMFAEAVSKLDRSKASKELLTKLFLGFPQSVCKATLIGKPAIVAQDDVNATLRLRVRVGVDAKAYAAWHQNATQILRQISQKVTPFRINSRKIDPANKKQVWFRWGDLAGSLDGNETPVANQDKDKIRFSPQLDNFHVFQKHYNKIDIPKPLSGLHLFVSKFTNGLEGEAYELDEVARLSIFDSLLRNNTSKNFTRENGKTWKNLNSIGVEFKSGTNELIKACKIDTANYTVGRSVLKWLAPYGPTKWSKSGIDMDWSLQHGPEESRMIFVIPGFVLESWTEVISTVAGGLGFISPERWALIESEKALSAVISAGVALDYDVSVSLDELRMIHHVELSLGK